MTEPTKLSPEEQIRAREFFIKHYEGDSDFNLNHAYQFAEAYASHISAPLKARVAELEYLLGLAEKNYREDQLRAKKA